MNFGESWSNFINSKSKLRFEDITWGLKISDSTKNQIRTIFDFFDRDSSGELDYVEIGRFISTYQRYANKDGISSIFSTEEMDDLINNETLNGDDTLADYDVDSTGFRPFLAGLLFQIGSGVRTTPQEHIDAIAFLNQVVKESTTTMIKHEDRAGFLSDTVNLWNEIFNSEVARSTAEEYIEQTAQDAKILSARAGYSDFEEIFQQRRGVEFNADNIHQCQEAASRYAQVKTSYEMILLVKQELHENCQATRESHGLWNRSISTASILKAFSLCGIKDLKTIELVINKIAMENKNSVLGGTTFVLGTNSQGEPVIQRFTQKGHITDITLEQMEFIANELGKMLDKSLLHALGVEYTDNMSAGELSEIADNTIQKYKKEYEDAFQPAFGENNAQMLAERYIEHEQKGVQYVEMGLNILNMAIMFVPGGALASAPGWLAKGLTVAKGVGMLSAWTHPVDFLEKLTSNGISDEEFNEWWMSFKESTVFMGVGMGVGKLAENFACIYKTRALVNTLRQTGKSADEIMAIIKANPLKFPDEVVESLKRIDSLAKAFQITSEAAMDIMSTSALTYVMHGEKLNAFDIVQSMASAVAGGTFQRQFKPLSANQKVKYLRRAFKDMNLSRQDAIRILNEMDNISAGRTRNTRAGEAANPTERIDNEGENRVTPDRTQERTSEDVSNATAAEHQTMSEDISHRGINETENSSRLDNMTQDEVIEDLHNMVLSGENISNIMEHISIIKNKYPDISIKMQNGEIIIYNRENRASYNIYYDAIGNIKKYSTYNSGQQYYVCTDNGMQKVANRSEYYKVNNISRIPNNIEQFLLTNPELFTPEIRNMLLTNNYYTYTEAHLKELSSLIKTPEDTEIVLKLMNTRGNDKQIKRFIGKTFNVEQKTRFGVLDIIKILQSDKAKNYVLQQVRNNKHVSRNEIEQYLANGEKFDNVYVEHNMSDLVGQIEYRTQDLSIEGIEDVQLAYSRDPNVKAMVNAKIPEGEAGCINGQMYCRVNDQLMRINLSKKTFDELFPVEDRYKIKQGNLENCWFISPLAGYMSTPNGRAAIYSMFREDGNDLYIRFPGREGHEIKFKNGNLSNLLPVSNKHVTACKGIKMIEEAMVYMEKNSHYDGPIITADKTVNPANNLPLFHIGSQAGTAMHAFGSYGDLFHETAAHLSCEEELIRIQDAFEEGKSIYCSLGFGKEVQFNFRSDSGLYEKHEYFIVGYDKENKKVFVVDPHNTNRYMEVPLEVFEQASPIITAWEILPPELSVN